MQVAYYFKAFMLDEWEVHLYVIILFVTMSLPAKTIL